jgi:hypothetical protein
MPLVCLSSMLSENQVQEVDDDLFRLASNLITLFGIPSYVHTHLSTLTVYMYT